MSDDTGIQAKITSVGGKAFHLSRMQYAEMPVPVFFCLSREDLQSLFRIPPDKDNLTGNDLLRDMDRLTADILSVDQPGLQKICSEWTQRVLQAPIADTKLQQLLHRCTALFGTGYHVSVRSSAISEDSETASFAGQHFTQLFVNAANLISAIKKSLASAYSFSAISYRLLHNISVRNIRYAIVIQQMIDARVSGIAFSMNAGGNLADAVISAGYGLGEGIVGDLAATDTFFVSRATQQTYSVLQTKPSALTFAGGDTLQLTDVPDHLQNEPALTHEQVIRVYNLAVQAEKLLKKPADIEFCFNGNNELFILQMRPVTTIRAKNPEILDNTNIIESYPDITLPLSYTFAAKAYFNLFRNCARLFWINSRKFNRNHRVFENLIAHYYGRVYYRLDNWYRMTALVYNSRHAMRAWEKAVGLPDSVSDRFRFSLPGKIKTAFSVGWLILNYKRGNRRFFQTFQHNYKYFQDYTGHNNSAGELWLYFESAMERTFRHWPLTIVNDYLAFKSFGRLQKLIKRYGISDSEDFANELVCGYGAVDSELAVVRLLELKDYIVSDDALCEKFQGDGADIIRAIDTDEFPAFGRLWKNYLQRFGDRTLAELKLETVSPRMNPSLLVELLKSQLSSTLNGNHFLNKQKAIAQSAKAKVLRRLKPYDPRYGLFMAVKNLAAYGLMCRENMRFCRTRVYAVSRDIFLQIGSYLSAGGRIEDQRDVFYLTFEELRDYCLNNAAADYHILIKRRKQEFYEYRSIQLPDRIIYQQGEMPQYHTRHNPGNIYVTGDRVLQGVAVSKGEVEGEAIVITEPLLNADVRGKILVSRMTDPGWVFLMSQAIAVVTEKGSLLSHTAIIGRELGIPVVVGVPDVAGIIKTGDKIRVNGSTGVVEKI